MPASPAHTWAANSGNGSGIREAIRPAVEIGHHTAVGRACFPPLLGINCAASGAGQSELPSSRLTELRTDACLDRFRR